MKHRQRKLAPLLLLPAILLLVGLGNTAIAMTTIREGDRIAIVGNTFADQLRRHGYFETLLLLRTGGDKGKAVSIRNLGWGGDTLTNRARPTNFPSEESTLKAHKTDVIIACFGMGESFAGESGIDSFRNDLEAFIASHARNQYNSKSAVRLILVSPIAHENHGKRTPNLDKRNSDLAAYTRVMGEVAKAKNVPFVDLYEPTRVLMNDSDGQKLTTNGIHLNRYGYWAVSRMMADALVPGEPTWHLEVDAAAKTASGDGIETLKINAANGGLSFFAREKNLPCLTPPEGSQMHNKLTTRRDVVAFKNLPGGRYTLSIDGKSVITASSDDWEKGVVVDATPAHIEADAYRRAVIEKNLMFTYSWKALNQVHIVGERRGSPSGRALPGEVIEFNKLVDQKDQALQSGIRPKSRKWQLLPAK